MEKKKDKNDTELRMSQAVLVITECFRRFKRRGVDYKTLKLYLIENDILDTGDMKAIDAVTSLDELEKIVPRTFTASETLLLWMEEKKMVSDIDDLEKIQFLYVLQRLVEDETKYHSKGDCKKRMKVFTTSRRLRSGNEKEESKDLLYYSLLHAIGNVYEVTRVQMKDKLLQYLCRHPAYRFDISRNEMETVNREREINLEIQCKQLKRIDPEAINDWLGFIDYLQGWETKGHPFVMHAFTEVFSVSLHVISAVTSEEYVLYPKRYFKKANTRRKTYLGHVQRHHYISLSEEPPNFEDLCGEIGGLQDHVKHLRRQMQSKQDENKTNIDRFSETIDDKDMEIIQLKKKIKQLTVDLQQTTKELEQVTQTARDMKSQFRFLFRFLGNMMDVFSSIDGSSNSKSLETTMLEQVTAQLKAAKETQSQSQSQSQFSESGFASNVDDCEDELFESFS